MRVQFLKHFCNFFSSFGTQNNTMRQGGLPILQMKNGGSERMWLTWVIQLSVIESALKKKKKKKPIPYHSCLFISRRHLCRIHGFPGQRPNLNWERGRGGRRKVDDLIYSKQKPTTLPRGRSLRQRWLIQHRYLQVSIFGEGLSRGKDY